MSRDSSISVRNVWARLVVQELKKHGVDVEAALTEAGLEHRSLIRADGWVPYANHARLFEIAARELKDDCFGLNFARTIDVRDVGVLAYLGVASQTLEDAIRNLARYTRVFSEAFEFDLKVEGDTGTIEIIPQDPSFAAQRQAVEFAYAVIVRAYRQFTGKRIKPLAVYFLHQRRTNLPKFTKFFGGTVKFGRNQGEMVFSRRELATPILSSDERLLAILRDYAEGILRHRPKHRDELLQKIERRLTEILPTGQGRAKILAAELGMSERTLVRRLAELDTSFADLVDELRHDLARKYLAQRDLSLVHIAFLLGYSNQSAFNLACKRWSGKTPREVRAERASRS